MLFVERIARCQGSGKFGKHPCQEAIVEMYHHLASILAGTHQPDGDAVGIGVGVELGVPAKTAHVGLVGKIDGDLGPFLRFQLGQQLFADGPVIDLGPRLPLR